MIYQKKSDGSWISCGEYMGVEGDQTLNGNLNIVGGNGLKIGGENEEKYCEINTRRKMFGEVYESSLGVGGLNYQGHAQIALNKRVSGTSIFQNRYLFGKNAFYTEALTDLGTPTYKFNCAYFRQQVYMGNDSTVNTSASNEYGILNFRNFDNSTRYGYIGKAFPESEAIIVRAQRGNLQLIADGANNIMLGQTGNNYMYTHFGAMSWRLAPNSVISGMVNLGSNEERFNTLYCTKSPNVSSDKSLKENIVYVNSKENLARDNSILNNDDMYEFVRDDLKLAKYNYINKREDFKEEENDILGFIAQDIKEENKKVADILLQEDKNGLLSYDSSTYTNILAGALQKAIDKIEKLELEIALLKNN